MKRTLLSIGHGYSAQALARILLPRGWRVIGTTRSADKARALRATGAEMMLFPDPDGSVALGAALKAATHLLVSIGPKGHGDPVLNAMRDRIEDADLQWAGYLSTTGVYGDHAGRWVDETSALNPGTERGRWRLQAEQDWSSIAGLPLHIFRLAGIYGPGRGPFAKVRNGTARRIIKPGQVFSRIHVDDIAQVLAASIDRPDPGAVYNLCDDDPAPPQDVIAHAAALLDLPLPEAQDFDRVEMTPLARSFYSENKRVSNDRIKRDLGVKLLYPSYRDGLAAMVPQPD
ncbi:SDR family oxidoreductase [Rhodobacteraceae bacterium F11138]|nr:SDR family oxidoreductase [Rhodobacteraceae bacterium F11138]